MKMRRILKGGVSFVLKRAADMVGIMSVLGQFMYLKKVMGPRAVTLPDGSVFSVSDLPRSGTLRWVASRKAAVVRGVVYGLITQAEALERYQISDEEFMEWLRAVADHGEAALRATALQKYIQL